MSRRKTEIPCEACGQMFRPAGHHVRTCSAACQEQWRRRQAPEAGSRRGRAADAAEAKGSWTGRALYSVPRRPPFVVVGRPILAESEELVFTSNSLLGEWEAGALLAAVFEKARLLGAGAAGVYADFGTVFLRLEEAQALARQRYDEEVARLAAEQEREKRRERERERQRQRERRSEGRQRRQQATGGAGADPRQCFRTLGLRWPCTLDDVKAAFRRLAHLRHPDKGGTTAGFIALREAYQEAVNHCLAARRH